MLNRDQMAAVQKAAMGFPADIASMKTDLAEQTRILQRMQEIAEAQANIKEPPDPLFLDLTNAAPSVVTGQTLKIVAGYISWSAAGEGILHVGEAGTFFHFWLGGGLGIDRLMPLAKEWPLIVPRGVRIWIETVGAAFSYHVKLVTFPS